MTKLYTKPFADYYDIRAEKLIQSVDQELDFFEFIFGRYAGLDVGSILDVGCGTGRHYLPLMQKGYSVTGVDQSRNMLNTLRKKAETMAAEPNLFEMDMREIGFVNKFGAVICMNTVFLYLLTDQDILISLKKFHQALEPGGVVIIDIMNFLSLLGRYKENVVENYTRDGVSFERAIEHYIENVPAIWHHREFGIIRDGEETITYNELHKFRMLNYNEMRNFLYEAGFSNVKCFGKFTDGEEVESQSKRLVFVAIKG